MIRHASVLRGQSMWFWVILGLAVALRFWIAAYNTDANDDHINVIQRIIATGELPVVGDCWQCYHVKAYHYPAAVGLARLSIVNPVDQLRVLQHGNVILGVLTLLVLWSWLSPRAIDEKWKLAVFALIALNPRFAAINAQVTNDSLVILAATVSFYFYARFLKNKKFINLWTALVFCALAAASKASGLLVAILIFGHLVIYAAVSYRHLARLKLQLAVFVCILGAISVLVPYSGYVQNAREAGSPLATNIEKFPFPNWTEEKRWSQAGTTSIVNTYLTFHWPGLIAHPYINKSPALYPEHRTNHWAQLFGRHAFSRFERWPVFWATNGYWTTKVGQAAMILSIVPLGLLIAGIISLAAEILKRARRIPRLKGLIRDPDVFLAMTAIAMIAMSLKLSLDFQTYGIMKAVYIYPGLLGILVLLVRGFTAVQKRMTPGLQTGIRRLLVALVLVHVLDLSILATDLHAGYSAQVQKLAAFEPARLNPNQIRLDRLTPTHPATRDDEVKTNKSYSDLDLTGGYRKYRFGFGVHGPSLLQFDLNREYAYFETRMALADESYSTDGVRFEIWGDGRRLYRGRPLVDHQVYSVRLNVSDISTLGLKVQPLGTSYGDLANWLHPVLTKKEQRDISNTDSLLR